MVVTHDTSGALVGSGAAVEGSALVGAAPAAVHRVEFVNYEPKLWWLRKPKAIPEEVAKAKVKKIAGVIREVVQAKQAEPLKEQRQAVKQAIAPMLQEMPAFDWVALYQQIALLVSLENARRDKEAQMAYLAQQALMQEIAEEEELLLLMA